MHRDRLKRRLTAASVFLLGVCGAVVAFSFLERHVIFQPSRAIRMTPESLGLSFERLELRTLDGERIAAWFVPAGSPLATLLFLHGNGGNMADRLLDVAGLRRAGFSVLIIDYRGYGESSGTPSEAGIYRDSRAAWDHLTRERGLPPGRIVLYGESLGAAAALHLAGELGSGRERGPGAVVLVGAFTSALEMGRRHFPFLPVRWLLRSELDNLSAIRQVRAATLLIHAGLDEVAPVEMGRRLHEASAAPIKEFLEVPHAQHNTLTLADRGVFDRIARFVERALGAGDSR